MMWTDGVSEGVDLKITLVPVVVTLFNWGGHSGFCSVSERGSRAAADGWRVEDHCVTMTLDKHQRGHSCEYGANCS